MTRWSEYHTPHSLDAAIQTLEESTDAAIIAGGTDLLLDLEQGRHPQVRSLIDITRIDALRQVEVVDDFVVIGAAVPLAQLIQDPVLNQHAPGLVEACTLIGGPQVRNVATLGGNIAHALPAGDGTIALLSHGAQACIASRESMRWVPLIDLFEGPGKVTFDRGREIITAIRFQQRQSGEGSAFKRVMRPQGVAIAILNMGVWLQCEQDNAIKICRITVGPGGPTPFLAQQTAQVLINQQPDKQLLGKAAQILRKEARFRTSPHRSTQAYREHLVNSLLTHTFDVAYQRACEYHKM